jgi:superfamily II DNA helicase RecQ
MQLIFVTASDPPVTHKLFCRNAHISYNTRVIRSSTDRPELGYHFLPIDTRKTGMTVLQGTTRLVAKLKATLEPHERIIVFFKGHRGAEAFATDNKCAVYHSQLPPAGNNKAFNLNLWDTGKTQVMAATTALMQGLDRPSVRHVVFHDSAYGLVLYHQGGGRAGRDGTFSYVFVVFDSSGQVCLGKQLRNDPSVSLVFFYQSTP